MSHPDILIVEDNKSVAQELQERLEELGYKVLDIACSGEEAIEKIK
jgi:CheY-like chemotaxis protein